LFNAFIATPIDITTTISSFAGEGRALAANRVAAPVTWRLSWEFH